MTGYRRRGVAYRPRGSEQTYERHVRASWSLPVFATAAIFVLVLAWSVPPNDPVEAAAEAPGAPTEPAPVAQGFEVGDPRHSAPDRDEFEVTERPIIVDLPAVTVDPGSAQEIALAKLTARGWGAAEFSCLVSLWTRESNWRVDAHNTSSGAYGIPQALPGDKMASAGADWRTNPATQIEWGLGYIAGRYGTPCGAWAHSEARGWY